LKWSRVDMEKGLLHSPVRFSGTSGSTVATIRTSVARSSTRRGRASRRVLDTSSSARRCVRLGAPATRRRARNGMEEDCEKRRCGPETSASRNRCSNRYVDTRSRWTRNASTPGRNSTTAAGYLLSPPAGRSTRARIMLSGRRCSRTRVSGTPGCTTPGTRLPRCCLSSRSRCLRSWR
jgi:hypothetical protein